MSKPSTNDAALMQLIELAQAAAQAEVDEGLDRVGRARLTETIRAGRMYVGAAERLATAWSQLRWTQLVGAAAIICLLGGVAWSIATRPVSFIVKGQPTAQSYVRAADARPLDVEFSDGTQIHMEGGSSFRVEGRHHLGARIIVERGRTDVAVTHHAGSDWRFVAGPFDVHVTGTRFWLDWQPNSQEFNLVLTEGSVEVTSPLSSSPLSVRPGQHVRANLSRRSLTIFDEGRTAATADPEPASSTPPNPAAESSTALGSTLGSTPEVGTPTDRAHAATPPAELPGAAASSAPSPSIAAASPSAALGTGSSAPVSWSKLLAAGQFETIVRLSESPSRPNCQENCSATELRTLAEAARYAGRSDLAESTLLALRKRFRNHPESQRAAFLLGRLCEARADRTHAEMWYRTYLQENPNSELAADALAGQMRTVRRGKGAKAAEPLAQDYLRRYPGGVHASAAEQILREVAAGTGKN